MSRGMLHRQRHYLRFANATVPREQGDVMQQAGSGDQLVSRIAHEVESVEFEAEFTAYRPYVDIGQCCNEIRIVKRHGDATLLIELGDLPKHDVRDPELLAAYQARFTWGEAAIQGMQQDVCVKIQHSIAPRWKKCRPGYRGAL